MGFREEVSEGTWGNWLIFSRFVFMTTDSDGYVARNVDAKLQQVRFFLFLFLWNLKKWTFINSFVLGGKVVVLT